MYQTNLIGRPPSTPRSHRQLIKEHLVHAVACTDDVKKQNRIVMARFVGGLMHICGCSVKQVISVQQMLVSEESTPSADTLPRAIRSVREENNFVVPEKHYHTERWRRRRIAYFEKHPKVCALCSSHDNINLHHKDYPHYIGEEPDDTLIPLCRRCHAKHHDVIPDCE